MDKKVLYIPARKRIVSLENSHKYKSFGFYKDCIQISNEPVLGIKFSIINGYTINVEYQLDSTTITARSKTDPNYIIKNCMIDDGIAYGPFIWAKKYKGMELVKVGTDLYNKIKKTYEDEHRKRIRKFVIGGIYRWRGSEYQYLGVCKYYKQHIERISMYNYDKDTTAIIELCESPMWVHTKYKTVSAFKCPRIYEHISTEVIDVNKVVKELRRDINNHASNNYSSISIINTIHTDGLTGNIKEYIDNFKDGKRIFKRYQNG
jgi:hypothetical protein